MQRQQADIFIIDDNVAGVTRDNAGRIAAAGADTLVAGSAVFAGGRYAENIAAIRKAALGK